MLKHVELTRLGNRARVVTARSDDAESVSTGIFTNIGGRHEPAALSGVCHFIEHMLFKGTPRRKAVDISRAIEGRGGYLNAYTSESSTCYYARLPHECLAIGFDVLSDMWRNATLAPADMEKERLVIVEELRMYRDQPQQVAQEKFTEAMWQNHALGRPLAGTEETLQNLTRDALAGFKDAAYLPSNTLFAFTGRNVVHADCVKRVADVLGGAPSGKPPAARRVTGATRQEPLSVTRRPALEQVHLVLGHRVFGRQDPRRHALRMLNVILGENMSSRLFQVVRERHGCAYAIHSGYQLHDETGAFSVSAGLDRGRALKALGLIRRELDRMRETLVTAAELRRTRDYTLGAFRLGLESVGSQMAWLGEGLLNYGRVIMPEEVIKALLAVTPEEIRETARHCFDPARLTLSVVVPENHEVSDTQWREACQ
ncbi:MAG: insulinase family protein [Kiritimatiellaeota bacterium]|nr:insulinase family protein [Kiritimatiellota bacterium]